MVPFKKEKLTFTIRYLSFGNNEVHN
jgi:hypothetical protein